MNNWQMIREFYDIVNPVILKEVRNEWAIDAYAWDTGLITMTPIECCFWQDIREANAVMYPQYPVGGVFLDFANPVAKVGVECDGKAFHLDAEKDRARDEKLQGIGWHIYRITGSDCMKDCDSESDDVSPGRQLMSDICDRHRISRNTLPFKSGFVAIQEVIKNMRFLGVGA